MKQGLEANYLRIFHILTGAILVSCVAYVYYAFFNKVRDEWLIVSMNLLLMEGAVLFFNKGRCPLNILHKKYGDDLGSFELVLPKKIAPLGMPFFMGLTVVGFVLVLV